MNHFARMAKYPLFESKVRKSNPNVHLGYARTKHAQFSKHHKNSGNLNRLAIIHKDIA